MDKFVLIILKDVYDRIYPRHKLPSAYSSNIMGEYILILGLMSIILVLLLCIYVYCLYRAMHHLSKLIEKNYILFFYITSLMYLFVISNFLFQTSDVLLLSTWLKLWTREPPQCIHGKSFLNCCLIQRQPISSHISRMCRLIFIDSSWCLGLSRLPFTL